MCDIYRRQWNSLCVCNDFLWIVRQLLYVLVCAVRQASVNSGFLNLDNYFRESLSILIVILSYLSWGLDIPTYSTVYGVE